MRKMYGGWLEVMQAVAALLPYLAACHDDFSKSCYTDPCNHRGRLGVIVTLPPTVRQLIND